MNNADVAATLDEIAELLELKNETSFRIRAYQNAGRAIGNLTQSVRDIAAAGQLRSIKGVGENIAKKIEELLETGRITYLEELRHEFPPGVRALMSVPGVGPSLARRMYHELGIEDLDSLRSAAKDGRLSSLPGLGEKSAQNIMRALSRAKKSDSRISIGKAMPLVEEIMAELRERAPVRNLMPAGSLRRWSPTIGDIDLMATSDDPSAVMDAFTSLENVGQVLGHGATKSTIVTDSGMQVDLRIVEDDSFGSLIQHFTGSRAHNIELREYALSRGLSLNEYGIVSKHTDDVRHFEDEASFYRALGLPLIPPEIREGSGEIDAARRDALPNLVSVEDIRGDLHMHSDWSDGSVPIETMVEAAMARGYEYVAITDHSGGIGVARGLHVERLLEQISIVKEIDARTEGMSVLTGTELEIKRDGTLDFPDEILAQLDWVVASVHSGFNQPEEEMTARIIRAIENPHVDAIGHPTGRLIGSREPYAVDLEAVFSAAARTGTVLEVNSFPERLDLVDTHARRAKELGVTLVINTDAHAPIHLENIRYGVAVARRAWLEPPNVLNTLRAEDLFRRLSRAGP